MIVKRRVEHGFHVPVIPKAPRSDRRRGGFKKKSDGNRTWAIELLAAVAGKLLLENESSSASSNEKETTDHSDYGNIRGTEDSQYDDGLFKAGPLNQQARQKETVCVAQIDSLKDTMNHATNQCLQSESALLSQEASVVSNSHCYENVVTDLNSGNSQGIGTSSKLVRKGEEHSHRFSESFEGTTKIGFVKHIDEEDKIVDVVQNITGISKKLSGSCVKSIRSPSSKGYIPETLSLKHRIVSLDTRDDDENIFKCSQRCTKVKAYRPIPHRRVKKFLTYKYKKVSSTWKDYNFPNAVQGMWPVCHNRKTLCSRERCQSDIPDKKMKLFDQGSVLTSDRGTSGESFCNMHEKSVKANMSCSAHFGCDKNVASSPPKGHKSSMSYKDSRVRLRIKSLRVPEIFIEVPENETVGSLKKRVFEAVAAMIGGGVHVGVRLWGRKVRDDGRTLLQTGISSKVNAGTLAFELEPNPVDVPLSLCLNDAPVVLSDSNHKSTSATPSTGFAESDLILDPPPPLAVANHDSESNHDVVLVPAPAQSLSDCQLTSRAIVPHSEMNAEELTVVPMDQKARRSELARRRTRRPFSVDEVEALVQSVEKLGTGRWRDVKLCAFEGANHRTYVDLKDKWKTLVHTAQIAPQQRRGQPVPQELLDRVLAAHAYWSQHQDKQIGRHQDAILAISTEV